MLLVSPDFIASEYCYDIETKRALERRAAGEAVVIPIVLRPVDWLNTPLAERAIIVPGNHDLSWDEEVYEWMQERKVDLSKLSPDNCVRQGKGYLVRDDALYPTRFKNFARFRFQRVFQLFELVMEPRDHSLIRVHTRCMRNESGAWDGWAVWPGDNASVKKAFYEIKLK